MALDGCPVALVGIDGLIKLDWDEDRYAWWRSNLGELGHREYHGAEATLDYLAKYFDTNGPFDGVAGFSQGAILASLLCKDHRFNFRFVLLIGGMLPRDPMYAKLFHDDEQRIDIPSLHVTGSKDEIVTTQMVEELAKSFNNPQFLYHTGNHFIPRGQTIAFKAFLDKQMLTRGRSTL